MKTWIVLKKRKLIVLALPTLLTFSHLESLKANSASDFCPVRSDVVPEILTMVSEKIRANYKRISTWEGHGDVTIRRIYEGRRARDVFNQNIQDQDVRPSRLRRLSRATVDFKVDLERDLLYSKSYRQPPKYTNVESGKDLVLASSILRVPFCTTSVLTSEHCLRCSPSKIEGNSVLSHVATKQQRSKRSKCGTESVFDPRRSFIVGGSIWKTLSFVLQDVQEQGRLTIDGHELKVEERSIGDASEYRVQVPGRVSSDSYVFMTMVFSSAKGLNIVSAQTADQHGKLLQKGEWEYTQVDAVYLPSRLMKQNFRPNSGEVMYEKRVYLEDQQVGRPMPRETFTYKNLGLKNGDTFVDEILDKQYTYQDGQLVEIDKKP